MPHNLGNSVEVDEIIIKQTLNMLDNLSGVNCLRKAVVSVKWSYVFSSGGWGFNTK